ncbi:helix-turn-helix domain-containing protein [Microbacterium sp. NPDC055910]|uniref:helix-turn-helix domain-containing protein n=1 Tax=Microbacterium sp. NPDC055910 TaxID=3345659 RepID=UPI0035DA38BA
MPSARLEHADPVRFPFEWASAEIEGLSVVSYSLTARVSSSIDPQGQLMACRVVAKNGWVGSGQRTLDASLPWLAADAPTRAKWDGAAHVRAFVFDRTRAEEFARQACGDDRLVLDVTDPAPRTAQAGRAWESTFRHVMNGLGAIGEDHPVLESEIRRHALVVTLSAFPTSYLHALERPHQTAAAPASVRRAMAYMDDHAREPVTVDDVAAAVRMSTRGMQYAFRRATGRTPSEYLRSARLAGAHAELLEGTAGTIAALARRWGFSNPSRFAQHYRAAYGCYPSDNAR